MKRFSRAVAAMLIAILVIGIPATAVEAAWFRNLFGGRNRAEESAAAALPDGHIVISMSIVDSNSAGRDFETETEWSPWIQYIMDRFNISFDLFAITWDDFIEVQPAWLAMGVAPDVMFWDIAPVRYPAFYVNATQDKFFRPYNLDRNPNLRMAFENGPTAMQAFMIDGNLYAWPGVSDTYSAITPYSMHGIMYRRDWAEAVGHFRPDGLYTFNQWVAMIKAVQEANPGEVGGSVIGAASVNWAFPRDWPIVTIPYFNRFVRLPDGSHTWGPFTPEAAEIVKLTNQLYNEGVIWQDQVMATGNESWDAFVENRSFSTIHHGMSYHGMRDNVYWYLRSNGYDEPTEEEIAWYAENVIGFGLVENPNGGFIAQEGMGIWSQTIMSNTISDETAERWEEVLDFLVSEEGYLTRGFGVRGTHWDYDAQGNFVLMWERDDNGELINPLAPYNNWPFMRIASNMDSLYEIWLPEFLNQTIYKQHRALLEVIHGPRTTKFPFNVDLAYFAGDQFLQVGVRDTAANDQILALLIAPPENVGSMWEAWLDTQRSIMDPVIAEINVAIK
jgi:hypothetical protein